MAEIKIKMDLENLLYSFSNYKHEEVRQLILSYLSSLSNEIERQKLVIELDALIQRSQDSKKQFSQGLISQQDYSVKKNNDNRSFIEFITQIDQTDSQNQNSDKVKWNKALRLDSRSGYEDFIREYPGNTYIRWAQNRLHVLNRKYKENKKDMKLWKEVENNLTYEGLLKYLAAPYSIAFRTRAEEFILGNLAEPKNWNALLFEESVFSKHLRSFDDFINNSSEISFSPVFRRELNKLFRKMKQYHKKEIEEKRNFWDLHKYYLLYEDEKIRNLIRESIDKGIKNKVPIDKYKYLDKLNDEIKGVGTGMCFALLVLCGVYYWIQTSLPEKRTLLDICEWTEIIIMFGVLYFFYRRVRIVREDIQNNVGIIDLPFPVNYNNDLEVNRSNFLINWIICVILIILAIEQIPIFSLLLTAFWYLLSVVFVTAVFLRISKSQLKYSLEDYYANPKEDKGILKTEHGRRRLWMYQ
jgi:hypothetical protein